MRNKKMDWLNFPVSNIFSAHFSLFLRYTAFLLDTLAHYNWQLNSLRRAYRKSWSRTPYILSNLVKWTPPQINLTSDFNKKRNLTSVRWKQVSILSRARDYLSVVRASDRPPRIALFDGICLEWTRVRNTDYPLNVCTSTRTKARQIRCVATRPVATPV